MWVWKMVNNPVAGDVIGSMTGRSNAVFSLMGIYVSHDNTIPVMVLVRTRHETSGETRYFFAVVVPAQSTFVFNSPDDPVIPDIGAGADEVLEIVAGTDGTYILSVGLNIRGVPLLAGDWII